MTEEEKTAYSKKLVQSNVDQHNKIVDLSKKVYDLQKESYRKEAQIEGMKRYLDCEYCEHYTQRNGCKNCNNERQRTTEGVTMFEKEAEDKAFEKYPIPRNWNEIEFARNTKYEEGFKDGAEFGNNKANKQLSKATEIIKMVAESGNGYSTWQEVVSKAEQFLSEVEK